MIAGERPLTGARAHKPRPPARADVTPALNVDGDATTDAIASSRFHPVSVKVSTLHTPTQLG